MGPQWPRQDCRRVGTSGRRIRCPGDGSLDGLGRRMARDAEPLRGQLLRLKLDGPPLAYCVMHGDHYVLSKLDGLITAGTTEESVGFDPSTTPEARDFILEGVLRLVPGLADA
ncbi:MAG: hypothetical protein C4315_12205, partial [Chloroflexota bacterium]